MFYPYLLKLIKLGAQTNKLTPSGKSSREWLHGSPVNDLITKSQTTSQALLLCLAHPLSTLTKAEPVSPVAWSSTQRWSRLCLSDVAKRWEPSNQSRNEFVDNPTTVHAFLKSSGKDATKSMGSNERGCSIFRRWACKHWRSIMALEILDSLPSPYTLSPTRVSPIDSKCTRIWWVLPVISLHRKSVNCKPSKLHVPMMENLVLAGLPPV